MTPQNGHRTERLRLTLFCFLSGVLLWLSFETDIWWLALVALGGLYSSLRLTSIRHRYVRVIGFAVGFYAPLLWWLHVLGPDAFILLTLLCCVLTSGVALIRISDSVFGGPLVFASLWTLVEMLRSTFPWGGFPWGLIGYSQNEGPIVSYARLGGSALVAFLVSFLTAFIVESVRRKAFVLMSIPMLLIVLPQFYESAPSAGSVKVAAVQGSVPRTGLNDRTQQWQVLQRHISTTALNKVTLSGVDLILWPESAAGIDPLNEVVAYNAIQRIVDDIGKPFLIGATTWRGVPAKPENVGILWQPKIGATQMYSKNHLVPFGEYVPYRNFLEKFINRFEKIPEDFRAGDGGGVFAFNPASFGDAICFEVAYDDHLRNLVTSGAQFLTAQSNNSTYLDTDQPRQQFQITRFRAIEHQRSIVVATTTGVSGVITSDGTVLNQTKQGSGEVVVEQIPTVHEKQPVESWPYSTQVLCVFILLTALITSRKKLDKDSITLDVENNGAQIGSESD